MRISVSSLAIIRCGVAEGTRYLAQWNPGWKAFSFVGGHRDDGETARECLIREMMEELGIARFVEERGMGSEAGAPPPAPPSDKGGNQTAIDGTLSELREPVSLSPRDDSYPRTEAVGFPPLSEGGLGGGAHVGGSLPSQERDPVFATVGVQPLGVLEYEAFSKSSQSTTRYEISLFGASLSPEAVARVNADSENRWLSEKDIERGSCEDGRAVSETVRRLLEWLRTHLNR